MTRYIALLRAINVGGHVVKMAHLRQLFEALGLANVETFIASGNVLFDSAARNTQALEGQIAAHLQQALGYEVATFLRSRSELAAIAEHRAFPASELQDAGASQYIGFLAQPLTARARRSVLAFRSSVDEFHIHGREIYWLCHIRSSDSEFSLARLEKALGLPATFRNATTVRKIAALPAALKA